MPRTRNWLPCRAITGQFRNEFAVSARDYAGQEFSLFVEKHNIFSHHPIGDSESDALLEVDVLAQEGEYVLIRLPAQTLENGHTVTVSRSVLQDEPSKQEA